MGKVTSAKPKVGGAIYTAPLGTTLPTDAKTTLAATYKSLGYVSEDGITNSNSPENEVIKAWGGDTVLSTQTSKDDTFTYTLIEALNEDVLKEIYGAGNVSGSLETEEGLEIRANSDEQEEHVIVIDTILKDGFLKRTVVPRGQVTGVGDITYKDGEAVGYETTLTAYPSADYEGDTHREYIVNPAITSGG